MQMYQFVFLLSLKVVVVKLEVLILVHLTEEMIILLCIATLSFVV